jgi:hypothetical protein
VKDARRGGEGREGGKKKNPKTSLGLGKHTFFGFIRK